MRKRAAHTIAFAIFVACLCSAYPALASQNGVFGGNDGITSAAVVGQAPIGDDLTFNSSGGFLRFVGGLFRFGETATIPSSSAPAWVLSGATVDLDFGTGQYYGGTLSGLITDTRASTAYASDSSGDLISFGPNVPRITNLGLLIEGSSTNIITQSGFASGWSPSGATLTQNAVTSPDGTTDAAFLEEDTSTGHSLGHSSISKGATAITYTVSFYAARVGQPRDVLLFFWDGSFANDTAATFNLGTGDTGTFGPTGFTNVGTLCQPASHSFWRCYFTFTTPATSGLNMQFSLMDAAGSGGLDTDVGTYTGDGTSGIYIYGPQLEQGTFPSSYIPTAASAVTRGADVVTLNGAAQTTLNSAAGTAMTITTGGYTYGTAANLIDSNGTALLGFNSSDALVDSMGSTLSTTNTGNRLVATDTAAVAWDATGRMLVLNGSTTITDVIAQTPSSTLHLGSTGSANFLNGYVARLTLWNSKLSTPQNNFSLVSGANVLGVFMAGADGPVPSGSSIFPNTSDWNYLQSKGVKVVRLSVSWEDLQPTLATALNSAYLTSIKNALAAASTRGISVIIDMQDYGHYVNSTAWGVSIFTGGNGGTAAANVYAIGDSNLPIADFTDLWSRMATALAGTAGLGGYELMNEPSGMASTTTWPTAAQDAINAIRAVDSATPIYVPGDGTAELGGFGAQRWSPSSVTGTNLIWDAHQYFDGPEGIGGGGTYSSNYSSYTIDNYSGVKTILAWLGWLKMNNLQGTLGEYGVPNDSTDNDPQWLILQQHVEALLAQEGVPAWQTFYGNGSGVAGNGATLQINPHSGVDDARLTQMLGQF